MRGIGELRWVLVLTAIVILTVAVESYLFVARPLVGLGDPGWSVAGLAASPLVSVVALVLALSALRAYTSELRREAHRLATEIAAEVFGGFSEWPDAMDSLNALSDLVLTDISRRIGGGIVVDDKTEPAIASLLTDTDTELILSASAQVRHALGAMLSSATCLSYIEWRSLTSSKNPALALRTVLDDFVAQGVLDESVMPILDERVGVLSSASMQLSCWRHMVSGYDLWLRRRPREVSAHRVLFGLVWGATMADKICVWLGDLTVNVPAGQVVISMAYLLYLIYELWPDPDVLDQFVIEQLPAATRQYLPETKLSKLGARDTIFGRSLVRDLQHIRDHPETLIGVKGPQTHGEFIRVQPRDFSQVSATPSR